MTMRPFEMNETIIYGKSEKDLLETYLDIKNKCDINKDRESSRKFLNTDEFKEFMLRFDSGEVSYSHTRVFPYDRSEFNVSKELWFCDSQSPSVKAGDLKKSYVILHVHFHSRKERREIINTDDFRLVDAANVRHLKGWSDLFDVRNLPIEPSGKETWKIFPEPYWECRVKHRPHFNYSREKFCSAFVPCNGSRQVQCDHKGFWICTKCQKYNNGREVKCKNTMRCWEERPYAQWDWQQQPERHPALYKLLAMEPSSSRTICKKLGELLPHLTGEQQSYRVFAPCIGIYDYVYLEKLRNSGNDAKLFISKLESPEFSARVWKVVGDKDETTFKSVQTAIQSFKESLSKANPAPELVFVSYAGHAVQLDGSIYLLASDFDPHSMGSPADSVYDEALKRFGIHYDNELVSVIQKTNCGASNIFVLDACRNSPFDERYAVKKHETKNSNSVDNTLFLYSTRAGREAEDGSSCNSFLAKAIAENLFTEKQILLAINTCCTGANKHYKDKRTEQESYQMGTIYKDNLSFLTIPKLRKCLEIVQSSQSKIVMDYVVAMI